MTLTIGIDPGGATTGIVLRFGLRHVEHELVDRVGEDWWLYLRRITAVVDVLRQSGQRRHGMDPTTAMEDLNPPNPHLGVIRVDGMLDVARVDGWLRGSLGPDLVIVPPGNNGGMPLPFYPAELVGPNETKGTGKLRHCRSAWDVAGHARMYQQLTPKRRR